jgi:hypothetical protein
MKKYKHSFWIALAELWVVIQNKNRVMKKFKKCDKVEVLND